MTRDDIYYRREFALTLASMRARAVDNRMSSRAILLRTVVRLIVRLIMVALGITLGYCAILGVALNG